jgi:hypothetical protein
MIFPKFHLLYECFFILFVFSIHNFQYNFSLKIVKIVLLDKANKKQDLKLNSIKFILEIKFFIEKKVVRRKNSTT